MANFISCNAWIWNSEKSIQIHITKLPTMFSMKFELGNSSVEMALDRIDLVDLRNKINDILLVESPKSKETTNG